MVTKSKKATGAKEQKKGRIQVGRLKLNKETIKDVTPEEARRIKGGATNTCLGEGVVRRDATATCAGEGRN